MQLKEFILKAFVLLLMCVLFISWQPVGGGGHNNPGYAASAICCSSDGKYVYATDLEGIYCSEDFGKTWKKATPGAIQPKVFKP